MDVDGELPTNLSTYKPGLDAKSGSFRCMRWGENCGERKAPNNLQPADWGGDRLNTDLKTELKLKSLWLIDWEGKWETALALLRSQGPRRMTRKGRDGPCGTRASPYVSSSRGPSEIKIPAARWMPPRWTAKISCGGPSARVTHAPRLRSGEHLGRLRRTANSLLN